LDGEITRIPEEGNPSHPETVLKEKGKKSYLYFNKNSYRL
jgi:hypothetical protein